jgi:hypothetical protein
VKFWKVPKQMLPLRKRSNIAFPIHKKSPVIHTGLFFVPNAIEQA